MSSTEAVKGSSTRYISDRPYQSTSGIGINIANNTTTKDEKLKRYQAQVEEWFSSPDHPLASYTARTYIERSTTTK
ncbi:hypothetical protein VE01_06511 [Pseudogymnoascus verrucosus]|uniref:Uncharacterized protein n=1 Tax=Pseudogymnoascus verrucosus TaxID=342668 RepID=A0A1B8GIQ6_9PEZI|nr:uncharacterized protein VE01_06511 [Pseudogymnoascus verrucosus]OBT95694.1 hypothetical protein VE01_06511 [Pseudogymnoascus verrucosus]